MKNVTRCKITLSNGQRYTLRDPEDIGGIDSNRTALFVFNNGQIYRGCTDGEVDDDGDFCLSKKDTHHRIGLPFDRLLGWAYEKEGLLMDCKNPLYRLQERLNELKTALNNLQIVFGMTEKQIEQLIIRIETIGVKQITKEALKELTGQASELLKYKVECIRESIKREPFPPYKERLHPRKHWQRKPYWLRTRSNPKKKGYH